MPGEIDVALREEIVESHKAKAEFIRWKLVIVAGLGVATLGLADAPGVPVLAALIPLVCIYVDSVCLHNDSRILVIADFLRTSAHAGEEAQAYEQHCYEKRDHFYGDGFVLFVSSYALSGITILWGVRVRGDGFAAGACVLSGALGLLVTYLLVRNFRKIQAGQEPLQLVSPGATGTSAAASSPDRRSDRPPAP